MPFQLAGIGIQGYQAARVKIVAGAIVSVEIRSRIARAPVDEVELGIVGAGNPGRAATALPRIATPGGAAWLAFGRDSPEAPDPLSGIDIVSVDEPTRTEF